ncbi:MAG: CBS domain-containing protein, partial [Nanoarchaeota archaeon]|nr:CBS domain-containing protein [Nanoarchaeota archaeon]
TGLTQKELANAAGVSQSLIAKIESGRIDPAFSNAQKILETLANLQKKQGLTAKDLMRKKIICCNSEDKVKEVIGKMKQYEISQLPVIDNEVVMGLISESIILNHLFEKNNQDLKVKQIMSDCPPIISEKTAETVISNLLKFFPLVIVKDKGKLSGLITKSDVLRNIYK